MKIISPHRFKERLLLFGGGGSGKTSAGLSIASVITSKMFVIDSDYSMAWNRGIDLDFEDARDTVTVLEVYPEWEPWITQIEELVASDANDDDNWLVIDPVSPSWDWVQSWFVELAMGKDVGHHMAELRRDSGSTKEYQGALAESMSWPVIKRAYARLYKAVMSWHGHLILMAEAKSIRGERDADQLALYGQTGYKPVGEGRLHHVTSTTLFLQHAKKGWELNTVKDRNRVEVEHGLIEPFSDGGFATSYLREVAGWQLARKAKVAS